MEHIENITTATETSESIVARLTIMFTDGARDVIDLARGELGTYMELAETVFGDDLLMVSSSPVRA